MINNIRNKYKKHIEIIIRFSLYQKEKKEKQNKLFSELKERNKESVYLINSELIENFKDFFEYQKIEMLISPQLDQKTINSKSDNEYFENIISKIPNEYFNKFLIKKNKILEEKKIKGVNFEISKIKPEQKLIDIKSFSNFQIVNQVIYGKLMVLEYNFPQIQADLYYPGNNKLIISFQNQISCDEIGFINEQDIFIPEYILYYINNNVDVSKINLFANNFNNNSTSNLIYDVDGNLVGYCYSKKDLNKQIELEEYNINNNNNIDEQENKKYNISPKKISDTQSDNINENDSNKNIKISNPENKDEAEKISNLKGNNNNEENIQTFQDINL